VELPPLFFSQSQCFVDDFLGNWVVGERAYRPSPIVASRLAGRAMQFTAHFLNDTF
jgi:hypothetical protein